ncbi:hypothetical protein ACOMHN_014869 [Nucella lapillus]
MTGALLPPPPSRLAHGALRAGLSVTSTQGRVAGTPLVTLHWLSVAHQRDEARTHCVVIQTARHVVHAVGQTRADRRDCLTTLETRRASLRQAQRVAEGDNPVVADQVTSVGDSHMAARQPCHSHHVAMQPRQVARSSAIVHSSRGAVSDTASHGAMSVDCADPRRDGFSAQSVDPPGVSTVGMAKPLAESADPADPPCAGSEGGVTWLLSSPICGADTLKVVSVGKAPCARGSPAERLGPAEKASDDRVGPPETASDNWMDPVDSASDDWPGQVDSADEHVGPIDPAPRSRVGPVARVGPTETASDNWVDPVDSASDDWPGQIDSADEHVGPIDPAPRSRVGPVDTTPGGRVGPVDTASGDRVGLHDDSADTQIEVPVVVATLPDVAPHAPVVPSGYGG